MNTNERFADRSRKAIWHPCTQMKLHETVPLVPIARADGVWLYDMEGHRILDAIGSWWVNLLGHGHPRINAALREQLESLEHVMLAGLTHAPAVELSERLAQLAPGGLGHVFFGSDGASAVEIALKMSCHYWRNVGRSDKTEFVTLANSYHGETLGALSVSDIALYRQTYEPLLRKCAQVPSPDWRRADQGEAPAEFALRCAAALEAYLERHAARTAAFIVEPLVQCAGGMAMHDARYLKRARELCSDFDVHLIADEIAVGFGRTGTMFACEQANIVPDYLCLSKGLTGGYLPLSVVMVTDTVYQAFYDDAVDRAFLHSHSYSGNPLACRAALAVLDTLEKENVLERNHETARYVNQRAAVLQCHRRVESFRNTGMIWAFEVRDPSSGFSLDFFRRAIAAGVLLRPIGSTVYWMPPYVIDESGVDFLVDAVVGLLDRET